MVLPDIISVIEILKALAIGSSNVISGYYITGAYRQGLQNFNNGDDIREYHS